MSTEDFNKKFEELNLSSDEVKNLTEAFKKEEFRKLFCEYAEEISDPENRRKYEEEIRMLENERGMDVDFVHPNPGFVLKTTVKGDTKVFLNVCQNDKIGKPSSVREAGGLNWSIPHSFSPPRDDTDSKKNICKVLDFVVHPDTYRMAESNQRFEQMLHSIAFEGMDKQFDLVVDRKNVKRLKMKYKGVATATVIRNKMSEGPKERDPDDILNQLPIPSEGLTSEEAAKKQEEEVRKLKAEREKKEAKEKKEKKNEDKEFTEPKYTIKHCSQMDMANYTNDPYARLTNRPSELVVEIDLPLVKSAASVDLDIFEKKLTLTNTKHAKYKLELNLPYAVDENQGKAKFDKAKKKLCITLPVLPPPKEELPNIQAHSLISELSSGESRGDEGKDRGSDPESSDEKLAENLTNQEEPSPLVEELEPDTPSDTATPQEPDVVIAPQPKISYNFPSNFDYQQDGESVSVVIHLRNVSRDDTKFTFNSHGCEGKMLSVGSGGFPMHYSFMVEFEEDYMLEPENCYVSQSPVNIAITMIKSDRAIGLWKKFKVGVDAEHLEERVFLSEQHLRQQLEELEEAASMPATNAKPSVEVTEMNEEALTVNITASGSGDGPRSPGNSGEDIEVVFHAQQPPRPRGILKQRSRTLSDSSDDLSSSYNGGSGSGSSGSGSNGTHGANGAHGAHRQHSSNSTESPITEESGGENSDDDDVMTDDAGNNGSKRKRNKSVSFNEHVDKTTYKVNASVSSMTPALKSKRRRQRKMEQKRVERHEQQQQRRIRRSSGSEHSSCDELERQSKAAAGDEDEEVEKVEREIEAQEDVSTGATSSDAQEKKENGERTSGKKNKKRKNRRGKGGKKSESDASGDGVIETGKAQDGEATESKKESGGEQVTKADGDGPEQKDKPVDRTNPTEQKENVEPESKKPGQSKGKVKLKRVEGDSDDDADDTQGVEKGKGEGKGAEKGKGESKGESNTMLSWQDGPVGPVPQQSAVVLNNSVMYDLDMD